MYSQGEGKYFPAVFMPGSRCDLVELERTVSFCTDEMNWKAIRRETVFEMTSSLDYLQMRSIDGLVKRPLPLEMEASRSINKRSVCQ